MARWLKVCIAPAEDLSLVPRTLLMLLMAKLMLSLDLIKLQLRLVFSFFFTLIYLVCMCQGHAHSMVCIWRPGSERDLVLSFQSMELGDQTQVIRLASKYHCLLSHLSGPFEPSLI